MKTVPLLNPVRKPLKRAALPQKLYVSRRSQRTGKAPTARLKARRAVAVRAGTFPNPNPKIGKSASAYYTLIDCKGTVFYHSQHATQENAASVALDLQSQYEGLIVYVWPRAQYEKALFATVRKLLA